MADSSELMFLLKMRDEATATLKQHGAAVEQLGASHQKAAHGAEEHEASLKKLVSAAGEAAEAFAAVWAASELNEKTLEAWSEMGVALTRVQQATGVAKAGMRELQEAIEQTASKSLDQTNEQIAGVVKAAGQLGVQGVEGLKDFTTTVSQLSTVTGLSVQQVTQGMSQILAATDDVQDGAKKFGDAFAYLADKTKGGGEGLLQSAEMLTQMTAGMKLTTAEVLGMASAVDNLGLRAGRASMTIGMTMTKIADFASEGGEKLHVLAAAAGITTEQFKAMAEEYPAEALNAFLRAIRDIQSSGGNVGEFLKQFGLSGRSLETTLVAAAKAVDQFSAKEKEAGSASNNGLLNKQNEQYMQLFTAAVHEASQALTNLGEAFGQAAAPVFIEAIRAATVGLEALDQVFTDLPGPIQTVLATMVIAAPIVLAGATAFRFLTEVVLTGAGVYRNLSGLLGEAVKSMLLWKGATEEAVVAEEALAGSSSAAAAGVATVSTEMEHATASGLGLLGVLGRLAAAWAIVDLADPKDKLGTWIDTNVPGAGAVDNFFSNFGLGRSYDQQRDAAGGGEGGADSEAQRQRSRMGGAEGSSSSGGMGAQFASDAGTLSSLDSYQKKMEELSKQQQHLNELEKAPPEELERLGLSQEQLAVYQKMISTQMAALDPLTKLNEQWRDQLRSAQAVTKEQENQAAIDKAVEQAK